MSIIKIKNSAICEEFAMDKCQVSRINRGLTLICSFKNGEIYA